MNQGEKLMYQDAMCCVVSGYDALASQVNDSEYTKLIVTQLEQLFNKSKEKGLSEIVEEYEERTLSFLKELKLKQEGDKK